MLRSWAQSGPLCHSLCDSSYGQSLLLLFASHVTRSSWCPHRLPIWRTMRSACCNFPSNIRAAPVRGTTHGASRALSVQVRLLWVKSFTCTVSIVARGSVPVRILTMPLTIRLGSPHRSETATCERLNMKEKCENPLLAVSRLWNHSFKTVMVQRKCVSGFKFKFSLIIHRSFGLELFNIPLCLAIRQAWQRPQMPKIGRRKEFKQVLGKCSVFGRMKSFVKNTLVFQHSHSAQTAHPEVEKTRYRMSSRRLNQSMKRHDIWSWIQPETGRSETTKQSSKLNFWEGLSSPLGIYKYNLPKQTIFIHVP